MSILGDEGSILFFNSLMHGIDIRPILRMDMPLSEMAMGFIGIFTPMLHKKDGEKSNR